MTYRNRSTCRICSADLPEPFLHLGVQPFANNLPSSPDEKVPMAPLAVTRCLRCGLAQLTAVVAPEILFRHYLYTPSQSATFRAHFQAMAQDLTADLSLRPNDLVVDIGSNDGLLLKEFQKLGMRVQGVEPAENLAAQANADGITTITGFWDGLVAHNLRGDGNTRAALITANNVFAHVDDWHLFLIAVGVLIDDEGVLSIEVPALEVMLRDGTFDLIYHEHLSYIDPFPLQELFAAHDMQIFDVQFQEVHGGSHRILVQRKSTGKRPITESAREASTRRIPQTQFDRFARRVKATRTGLTGMIRERVRGFGKKVVGYGAPAKATVLISACGLTEKDIAYIVDDNPLKQGRYIPGTAIPIVPSPALDTDPPDTVVIFPWNLSADILPKVAGKAGEAIIPMPSPTAVPLPRVWESANSATPVDK